MGMVPAVKQEPMAASPPIVRLRSWLLDQDGFRAKILGAAVVSFISIGVLTGVFLLVALHFYGAGMTGSETELTQSDIIKTVGAVFVCMVAIAVLLAATWFTFQVHSQRLAKVEEEGKNVRAIIDASPNVISCTTLRPPDGQPSLRLDSGEIF